ncbi:hypothetical protein PRZ48_008539 [Zasmidium cellare]|uniref:Aldehyde dehydrogenase domain-containing protein n=1 Tax=Zasmidium cellare TaxID=395010 RepID=A0ABR0EGD7_ZASCE|nr:hypothetical protein PRZ48_008539 [Zasmidium cellare]
MAFVEHSGKQVIPLWIGGKPQPLESTRFLEVTNARDSKVVHYAQGADAADAKAAVDAAAEAFKTWRYSRYNERREMLLKAAAIMDEKKEELAAAQVLETSCTWGYARFMPVLASGVLREIAGNITTALTGSLPPMDVEGYGLVMKEPIGPVLCIPPWNSPAVLGGRGIASALAAGCTVVLKASEVCPWTYRILVDIFEEAGLPKGCLNQVQSGREHAAAVTEALISHKDVRKIEFIGSAAVGSMIAQTAAKHLKPIWLELGGKGPAIVLQDADLTRAAKLCAFGAFLHHGQICFSTERIIVVQSVADEFCRILKEEVDAHYTGEAGAAALKSGADNAHAMIESAVQNGAKILAGDNAWLDDGHTSLRPTIITNVSRDDKIRDHETFGPSASLYVVDSEEEAINLANDSAYGLNATIWTNDTMKALDYSRKLEYGQVHVNTTTVNDPATVPVSGVKGSGWGDNNAAYGISEFLVNKTVTLHRADEPITFGN